MMLPYTAVPNRTNVQIKSTKNRKALFVSSIDEPNNDGSRAGSKEGSTDTNYNVRRGYNTVRFDGRKSSKKIREPSIAGQKLRKALSRKYTIPAAATNKF